MRVLSWVHPVDAEVVFALLNKLQYLSVWEIAHYLTGNQIGDGDDDFAGCAAFRSAIGCRIAGEFAVFIVTTGLGVGVLVTSSSRALFSPSPK